jgi:hypothetical protein
MVNVLSEAVGNGSGITTSAIWNATKPMSRVRPLRCAASRRSYPRGGTAHVPGRRSTGKRVLSPCGLIYTVRTGTSRQGRPIAENGRDGIGVRSPRRVYATAGAGGWFVPEEMRIDSRAGAAAEPGERDELGA